ncbi:PTS transporter subunit EIIB [Borrelia anserina]|uniref:PTS EIIB type-1 domain-containing protein n=2 Tax=Borrelia anserina TaxID=143 RepID=W5SMF6_BORAN|nr:Hypothetical protein BAN_0078600 [Borrelia anserina BA2]
MTKDITKTSKHILECFGGTSNIKKVEKDLTRIKILVDSNSLVKRENLTKDKNIIGAIKSNEFTEIVMNFEVIDDVYSNIMYMINEKI